VAIPYTIKTNNGLSSLRPVSQDMSRIDGRLAATETFDEYYSGNQVALYIGNIWLDDISFVQYQMTQNKRPFWGYKSQQFDTVAKGTQLVSGMFSTNFKHTNWLNMVISAYLDKTKDMSPTSIDEGKLQEYINALRDDPTALEELKIQDPSKLSDNQIAAIDQASDATKMELFKNYFWGPNKTTEVVASDNLPLFDIVVYFGAFDTRNRYLHAETERSLHTMRTISGVSITGHSMQYAPTGEPVQEVFTFLARSVNTPLTRTAQNSDPITLTR